MYFVVLKKVVGSWQLEEVLSAVPAESGKMFLEVTDGFSFRFSVNFRLFGILEAGKNISLNIIVFL